MIATILSAGRTFKSSLSYNAEKVVRGVAEQVMSRNLPDGSLATVWSTFRRYQENEAVHARTRAFGFHLAVSPGPEDSTTEGQLCQCVDELMEHIGYGKQPYVFFRHNDISRQHYHVVSIRVDSEGKSLWKSYDAKEVMSFMRSVQEKYGFTLGKAATHEEVLDEFHTLSRPLSRFDPAGDVRVQFTDIFDAVLELNFSVYAQFLAMLEAMGVAADTRDRKSGDGKVLVLRGLNASGDVATRPFSMENDFGRNAVHQLEDALRRNGDASRARERSRMKVLTVCEMAMDRAGSFAEFREFCSQAGVEVFATRKDGSLKGGVFMYDVHGRSVFSSEDIGPAFTGHQMRRLVGDGIWHVADEEEKRRLGTTKLFDDADAQMLYFTVQLRRNSLEGGDGESRALGRRLK